MCNMHIYDSNCKNLSFCCRDTDARQVINSAHQRRCASGHASQRQVLNCRAERVRRDRRSARRHDRVSTRHSSAPPCVRKDQPDCSPRHRLFTAAGCNLVPLKTGVRHVLSPFQPGLSARGSHQASQTLRTEHGQPAPLGLALQRRETDIETIEDALQIERTLCVRTARCTQPLPTLGIGRPRRVMTCAKSSAHSGLTNRPQPTATAAISVSGTHARCSP